MKSEISRFSTSFSSTSKIPNYILNLKGGYDELTEEPQDELVKSVLAKTPQSPYTEISINKFLKKGLELGLTIISDPVVLKILAELEKPPRFLMIQPTSSNRLKGFEKITDDFKSRLKKQEILNEYDRNASQANADYRKMKNRLKSMLMFTSFRTKSLNLRENRSMRLSQSGLPHKKTASVIKQEKIGSNVNSLGQSDGQSSLFRMRASAPSSVESNIAPTPSLFSADPIIRFD
jgi:hypothetical protein